MHVPSAKNLKKLVVLFVMIVAVVSWCPQIARAVAPSNIITYQGRLLDSNGVPVSSATVNISFSFYTLSAGGTCLWSNSSATCVTTTARSVTLTDGLFTENLGDTTASYAAISDSVFADNAGIYLEVVVGGETLTPRKQITAAPYAINAHKLDGLDASVLQLFEVGTNGTYEDDDGVIIGADAAFTYGVGDSGDLRVADTLEVIGSSYFGPTYFNNDLNLLNSEAISNTVDDQMNFNGGNGTNDAILILDLDGVTDAVPTFSSAYNDLINFNDGLSIGVDGIITESISDAGFSLTGGNDLYIADQLGVNGETFFDAAVNIPDEIQMIFGNANDTTFGWVNATEDFLINNSSVTGSTIFKLGTATSATDFQIQDSGTGSILSVNGAGVTTINDDTIFNFAGAENLKINVNPTNGTAVNGLKLTLTGLDSGNAGEQYGLDIENVASSEAFDILINATNSDTDDQVGYGMTLMGGAGGFGTGLYINGSNTGLDIATASNGKGINVSTVGSVSSAFTNSQINLFFDQDFTGVSSPNNTGQSINIVRDITMNSLGQILTVSGDILAINNSGTSTAGTLTETASLISLSQSYQNSTGGVLEIDNNSAGAGIYIQQSGNGRAISIDATNGSASEVPLNISVQTSGGNLEKIYYGVATSLSTDLNGINVDLNTNVTTNDDYNINGYYANLPAFTANSSSGTETRISGFSVGGGAQVTTTATDSIIWNGLLSANPNITQTDGTVIANGIRVQNGSITTDGTQNGLYVQTGSITTAGFQNGVFVLGEGITTGSLNGVNIYPITPGDGQETALLIGDGWDHAIYVNSGAFSVTSTGATNINTSLTIDAPGVISNQRLCASSGGGDNLALTDAIIVDCSNAGQADYAEMYPIASGVTYGDIVVPGSTKILTEKGDTIVQMVKSTTAYQNIFGGVVVDNYEDGTSAGYNIAEIDNPMPVSLAGRVLVHVTNQGGAISVGDAITTSSTAGYGMKATEPGMIIGYALNDFSGVSGEVMIFIKSSWYAGNVISTDGSATLISDTLVMNSLSNASSGTPAIASQAFALRGSAWSGSSAQALDMKIQTSVTDTDNYRLSIKNTADTEVAYITNEGTMNLTGDLVITGRIYPSDRGTTQTSKYIFYDGSAGPGGDMMRTNAAGWSTGSYDFAEMFPSDEKLEAGDVVVFTGSNEKIGRVSSTYNQQIAGIISTRPGFLAGENDPNHFPVALAGRVPTKVNLEGGAIAVGDPLTTSSTAGYAMKATEAGMVVGYALEPYTGSGKNKITVFVNINYFDGGETTTVPGISNTASLLSTNLTSLNLEGGLYMGGNDILNIRRLAGLANLWSIEEDGTIKTESTLKTVITSYQNEKIETTAVTSSGGTFITLVGSAELQNGQAIISFEEIDPNFNDITSITEPIKVIITPNGPVSLYVSEKDNNGFTVRQISGNDSGVNFDWLVSATRKGFEPVVVEEATEATNATEATGASGTTGGSGETAEVIAVPVLPEEQETTPTIPEEIPAIIETTPQEPETTNSDPEVTVETAPSESPTQTSDPVTEGEGGLSTEPPSNDAVSIDSSAQTGA